MKVKVAQYIADFLADKGVKHVFTVTGGGAMHLNDAFGHHQTLKCVYNHHEQASAIAAEAYTRLSGTIAAVCVTSGPGGSNALTGVLGGWLDSIPMFIVSGQVKRETTIWATDIPIRQLGDQEFNIIDCATTMSKYAYMITDENELEQPEQPIYNLALTPIILEKIKQSKKPIIFAGSGIRLGDAHADFIELIEKLQIPVVTAWNAHDVLWDNHHLFCGRPGTVGTRGGNFVVENSDLILVLGCRLNIRQIGYNYKDFAKSVYKIVVDIDENELKKPTISPDMPIHADVKDVIRSMNLELVDQKTGNKNNWLDWCRNINQKYPVVLEKYYKKKSPINPYVFVEKLFEELSPGDKIVTGNGSACVITFQAAKIKKDQRLFTNSGCAAMGYGFPAAIGCCVAKDGERIICLDGDGSFQMNLQELQTVVYNKLNIKLFILNNNGYHSIRQTQTNLFHPPLVGVGDGNGLSFPDLKKLSAVYDIPYIKIGSLDNIEVNIRQAISNDGPVLCEVILDSDQNFEPKLSSRVLVTGEIVSPPIDDMFPFLDREEYESNRYCE